MNADRRELFAQIEPPPGGVERFARRLEEIAKIAPAGPRRRTLALAGAAFAAVALVAAVVLRRDADVVAPPPSADLQPSSEIYNSPAFDRLLGRPAQFMELTVSRNEQAAPVTELETVNDRVRVYRLD